MLNRHSKALNDENTIPDDWRKSLIVFIPKKDNSTALDKQRGIAKTCSSAKLFKKVLISRLKPIIDPQLSQCQSGFRDGRSTTEQLMALRCVIDTCRVTNMAASLVLVDFRNNQNNKPMTKVLAFLFCVWSCITTRVANIAKYRQKTATRNLNPLRH